MPEDYDPREPAREAAILGHIQQLGIVFYDPNLRIEQQSDPFAPFDFLVFDGRKIAFGIDVKVRYIKSDQYPDLFISKAKYDVVMANPARDYYIGYYFTIDQKLVVYRLTGAAFSSIKLKFFHRRKMVFLERDVYSIPASDYLFRQWVDIPLY